MYNDPDLIKQIVTIENDYLSLSIVPHFGGKMIELKKRGNPYNYLHCDVDKFMHSNFEVEYDIYLPPFSSGFDECFPSVTATECKFGDQVMKIPDHGFLWSAQWQYTLNKNNDAIILTIEDRKIGYSFTKRVTLKENSVEIHYKIKNTSKKDFHYLWSSHPLFNIDEGDEIVLSPVPKEMDVYWLSDGKLKRGDRLYWNEYQFKDDLKISVIPSEDTERAAKLFTLEKSVDSIGLKKKNGSSVMLSFNPDEIPFVGIWLCYNAWPLKGDGGEYTIGLEPTSSNKDDLVEAMENKTAPFIKSKAVHEWSFNMTLM